MNTIAPAIAGLRNSTKVKAVLAGGLVLGLGAAMTLAAWTDQEFATGTFTAGHFTLVGSTDGVTFGEHATDDPGVPAALAFSTGFNNLSKSSTVASAYVLHLDPATTVAGTGIVAAAAGSGAALSHLTYGVIQVAAVGDCTPGATGTERVPSATAFGSTTGASSFALTAGNGTLPGTDVVLCIKVTADASLGQGTSATATWQFTATSNS